MEWNLPWEGGCRCGQVRLRVMKAPLLAGACHCTGCQSMTASAFSLSLGLPADGLDITKGEDKLVPGGVQQESRHMFCSFCKTWMFTRPAGMDWLVNLRASMLDDHSWFEPFAEFWTREKLPWVKTPAQYSYEALPEESAWESLMKAFAEQGKRPR